MPKVRNPEKYDSVVKELHHAIQREKLRRFGNSFEERTLLMKQKGRLLDSLVQQNPEAARQAESFRDMLKLAGGHAGAERMEAAEPAQALHEAPAEFHYRAADYSMAEILAFVRERACPEPVRSLNMDFLFGRAFGFWGTLPDVTGVQSGLVGWRDLAQLRNDDTGQIMGGRLLLAWVLDVPHTGYYRFDTAASQFRVDVDYKLTGSGLWGLDSSIEIWVSSGLHIPGPVTQIRISVLEVSDDKSTGLGQTYGSLDRWYYLNDRQRFVQLHEGTTVTYAIELDIETWAENGSARVDVNDFWLPSVNPDTELTFAD